MVCLVIRKAVPLLVFHINFKIILLTKNLHRDSGRNLNVTSERTAVNTIANVKKNLKTFWHDITNQVSRQMEGNTFKLCGCFTVYNMQKILTR